MAYYISILLFSLFGIFVLVIQNARRIARGKVEELHPMSVRDLIRPSIETARLAARTALLAAWAKILEWCHKISYVVGKKFIEFAWAARGRHASTETPDEGAIARIWKEMSKEKERLRAHFVQYPEHVARVD